MTLNISVDAKELTLWTMIKFFLQLAVAVMPAWFLWAVVQVIVVPFWLSALGSVIRR